MAGIEFRELSPNKGYWQIHDFYEQNEFAISFMKCPVPAACYPYKEDPRPQTLEGAACRHGHYGPLCGVCIPGWRATLGDGICSKCPPSDKNTAAGIVAGVIAMFCLAGFAVVLVYWDAFYTFGQYLFDGSEELLEVVLTYLCLQRAETLAGTTAKKDVDHEEEAKEKATRWMGKIRICIGVAQVLTSLTSTLNVNWPKEYAAFMRSLTGFIGFNIFSFGNFGCISNAGFCDIFLSALFLPTFLVSFVGLLHYTCAAKRRISRAFSTKEKFSLEPKPDHGSPEANHPVSTAEDGFKLPKTKREKKKSTFLTLKTNFRRTKGEALSRKAFCYRVCLTIFFFLYPSTSTVIMQMLAPCVELANGSRWLRADLSVACEWDAPVHSGWLGNELAFSFYYGVACVSFLVWILGVPAIFFFALRSAHNTGKLEEFIRRHHAGEKQEPGVSKRLEYVTALVLDYKPEYWWWEVVELLRKLTITSIIVFIEPGEPIQLVAACLIALASIVVYVRANPLEAPDDNFLLQVCLFQVFLVCFCGLLIKTKVASPGTGSPMSILMLLLGVLPAIAGPLAYLCYYGSEYYKAQLPSLDGEKCTSHQDQNADHRTMTHPNPKRSSLDNPLHESNASTRESSRTKPEATGTLPRLPSKGGKTMKNADPPLMLFQVKGGRAEESHRDMQQALESRERKLETV